ncbi:hypothetical protein [Streptomyces blattellae]|uniref:hypothetical protein n=1 Tax=Streptomyces blattellae TaxID=2569855 RepID=UPI0012B88C6B|nr:hypothetical protein [Streptomyces blattellae]
MNLSKNPEGFDGPVAWETPGTRAALCRWAARLLAKMLGWIMVWLAWLYGVLIQLSWGAVAVLAGLPLVVIAYLVCAQLFALSKLWRMYRILKVYPWRQQRDGVRAKRQWPRGARAVFVLPNPDRPEKTESPEEQGGFFRIWDRVARKGFHDELWYAGDPRFACVVAKPGPKTLSYADQRTAYSLDTSPRRKGISPEARRRARAIGARVAD